MARERRPNNPAGTKWAIRIVPVFITGILGFTLYAVIAHLCVGYLYRHKGQHGAAIALIILYFFFLLLMIATYLRTFYTAQRKPGYVPWLPHRAAAQQDRKNRLKKKRNNDVEEQDWIPPDMNPDSPGLEDFYTKDVFICEADGRPRWCSLCWTWKPDRTSHSSELDRCVQKMDHLCPWVGGMVSETSFNFFFQFTSYTFAFCIVCLATAGYSVRLMNQEGYALDGRAVAILALGGLFTFFSLGMSMTSGKYIFEGITNIDSLGGKTQIRHLAIRVPLGAPSTPQYNTVTYPLPPPPNFPSQGGLENLAQGFSQPNGAPTPRDKQAIRTFAIVRTEPGENPWHLGYWRNFTSVMGHGPLEWFLPIRHSPCCNHESKVSFYEYGPLIAELKRRHMLPELKEESNGDIEMR